MCTIQERQQYNPFKAAIADHLRKMAREDASFRAKLFDQTKSIDGCLDYIVGEVRESGRCGFADDEIFSLAVHYYDEPNEELKQHKHIDNIKVVVNREMPFTEEEKAEARRQAFERLVQDEKNRLRPSKAAKAATNEEPTHKQLELEF